jgi:LytS/YehU family sensor histidine kinase
VPDELLDAYVPSLILQPLVENAIKHGVTRRAEGGEVTVTVARERGALRLAVRDNGPGLPSTEPSPRSGSGVGLSNARARLEQLYGDRHRFTVSSHPEGGVLVELSIPLRTAPQG